MQKYRQSVRGLDLRAIGRGKTEPISDDDSDPDNNGPEDYTSHQGQGSSNLLRAASSETMDTTRYQQSHLSDCGSTTYRQSWHPEWMNTNGWIGKMKMPVDLLPAAFDSDTEDFETIDQTERDAARQTMLAWEQSALREKWFPLLCNVARAVTQATPWGDDKMNKDVRQGVLLAVMRRFMEHAADRDVMAAQTKELLATIQHEDPALEVQLSLVAFMGGSAWTGADAFRLPDNFKDPVAHVQFQGSCEEIVQHRLHHINDDVSRAEAKLTDAIEQWTAVRQCSSCYGGGTYEVSAPPLPDASTTNGTSPAVPTGASGGKKGPGGPRNAANTVSFDLQAIAVVEANPSTGRRAPLPGRVTVTVEYFHRDVVVDSVTLKGQSRPSMSVEDTLVWNGAGVSFILPRVDATEEVNGFENIDRCYFLVTIEEGKLCGVFGGKHVAQIMIPVHNLFQNIAPLNSSERQKASDRRKERGDHRDVGIHFCADQFTDPDTGIGIKAALSMECRVEIHRHHPPRVDVVKEMQRRKVRFSERRDSVWDIDHHAALCDLAELLGELSDAENFALQLYADRFLIHPELLKVLCLVSFATKGNFSDRETREGMCDAVDVLATLGPELETKTTSDILEKGLSLAKRQSLERVVAVEEVCKDPSQAKSVFDACLHLLNAMGVTEDAVTELVRARAIEYGEFVARKLTKLIAYVPNASSGNSRMSVLLELVQRENYTTLLVKARAFYEIIDSCLHVLTNIIKFAKDSGDDRVQNFAYMRLDVCIRRIAPPLSRAVTAFFGELAQTRNPDPLGDACGVLTMLYERVMEMLSVIEDTPALEDHCLLLIEPFNSFLPSWFTLCEQKLPSWIRSVVKAEPLEAISPGKVFCNSSASDAKNILDAIYSVFDKVIDWTDPEIAPMYVTNFSKLVQRFVESFTDALVRKGASSDVPEEWMVCMCSINKFETTIQLFWQDRVFCGVCKAFGDKEGLLMYQCQSLKAESLAYIGERKDEFSGFIGKNMRGAALTFLNEAIDEANAHEGITLEEFNEAFRAVVTEGAVAELSIITNNTDKVSAPMVLIQAAKGLHGSFADFVLAQCRLMSPTDFKGKMLEALSAIEKSLESFNSYDHVPPEILFDLSHKSRALIQLFSQPTTDIIESLDGKKGASSSDAERTRLVEVLKQRSNDKAAVKYLKNLKA